MREIWNGEGTLPDDAAYYTLDNGEIKGRPYVRIRAVRGLSRWRRVTTRAERAEAIRQTVDNDAWMSARNLFLVSAIVRDVESVLLSLEVAR